MLIIFDETTALNCDSFSGDAMRGRWLKQYRKQSEALSDITNTLSSDDTESSPPEGFLAVMPNCRRVNNMPVLKVNRETKHLKCPLFQTGTTNFQYPETYQIP